MKFKILNKNLVTSLKKVNNLIIKHSLYPILENVLFEIKDDLLTLTTNNLELEITIIVSTIKIYQKGNTSASGKKLLDICRTLSHNAEITIETNNNQFKIIYNSNFYLLTTLPTIHFPNIIVPKYKINFKIPQNALKKVLNATYFSIAIQDLRYSLNGLLFEIKNNYLNTVATDGYRMAICKILINYSINNYSIILPRKGVIELIKILSDSSKLVSVSIDHNYFQIKIENLIFISKTIEGTFPDYESIVLNHPNKKIILNTILFKKTLSRVAIISNEKFKGVRIKSVNNKLQITTSNQYDEQALELLQIISSNSEIDISVNAFYIIDILNTIDEEEICLLMSNSNSSIQIQSHLGNSTINAKYIVMPLIV